MKGTTNSLAAHASVEVAKKNAQDDASTEHGEMQAVLMPNNISTNHVITMRAMLLQ